MRSWSWYRQTTAIIFSLGVTLMACGLPSARPPAESPLLASPVSRSGQGCVAAVPPAPARVEAALDKLPLYFVENRGQMNAPVAYYVQGRDTAVYFTPQGLTFALTDPNRRDDQSVTSASRVRPVAFGLQRENVIPPSRWILKLDFVGANPRVQPVGQDPTPAVISYFTGSQAQWQTGLPTYAKIVYPDLWPGIDLVYSGTGNQLKYTFVVKPGADPDQIKLAYGGATGVALTDSGQLAITTPVGRFTDERPTSYQEDKGQRTTVDTTYRVETREDSETWEYGFTIDDYDRHRELVIDPAIIVYAGYIGRSISNSPLGIAVDNAGNAYVTGATFLTQTTFPVKVGPDKTHNGDDDAFVAKVNVEGTALVYVGYIGGRGSDLGTDIAVDCAGNAYVTGITRSEFSPFDSSSFPAKVGPDITLNGLGTQDAFVAKVNAKGTDLIYAGYIGGFDGDGGYGIAVDSVGNAYVTGSTFSTEVRFPVRGGPDLTHNGDKDAFVAKVKADGTALVYAGYIGGNGEEDGQSIAVDSAGNVYVTGSTDSTEATFPVKVGPDLAHNGGGDAFVAKVNTKGTAFSYAGYIGGNGEEDGYSIAVDDAGNAYVAGRTKSTEATFPVRGGPDLTYNGGFDDAFIAKVNTQGTALSYAGYIGGDQNDEAFGITVDSAGNAYVAGRTSATEVTFPVTVGPDLTHNGGNDAFVAKVNSAGTALLSAGYIGGDNGDEGGGIALDNVGNVYVMGSTTSTEATFPVTVGPDLTFNGSLHSSDAFVAKLRPEVPGLLRTQVTRLRLLFKDTVFVGGASEPEWVTLSGKMQLVTNVDVPSAPLSTVRTAETTTDVLAVARVSTKLIGVKAVGETTGKRYRVAPGPAALYVGRVDNGLVEFPKCYLLSAVGSKATSLVSTQVQLAVNEQGIVTEALAPATLVSWWQAEDGGGVDISLIADAQGVNHGVAVGTVGFVPGQVGQAFGFSGSGFVEVPDSVTLEPSTVTVMAWVRGSGYSGPNAYMVSKGAEECLGASYALHTGDSNGLVFSVSDGVTLNLSPDAGFGLWNGEWHLVAGTYDGHVVRLYVDGVEVGEGTTATIGEINYNLGTNGRFYIGAYRGTCDRSFTGDVDEVQVFSRALTAAEVESIYNATGGAPTP